MSAIPAWAAVSSPLERVHWRGLSGQHYALTPEPAEAFHFNDDALYVLVSNGVALWVGSERDLIEDHASRQKFKLASKNDCAVFRHDQNLDDTVRQSTAWDLENGRLAPPLRLVETV